jgi:transposase
MKLKVMNKILKEVIGVDVAQKELVTSLGRMRSDFSIEIYAHKVFKNTEAGIIALLKWAKGLADKEIAHHVVMEATGVYHEKFAYFLDDKGYNVSIILPNKISNYFKTLEIKTITDKSCSEAITRFGLERKLDLWSRPKKLYKELKQLTREREQIIEERTIVKNQLHAEEAEAQPNERSVSRLRARIKLFNEQISEIQSEIKSLVKTDSDLKQDIENITTIPGVGFQTAVTILAETNGFELIRNKKQLVSYAGLDVKEKISGTSVKGKSRISKRGNKHIRKALYLPSMTAIRCNETQKELFVRIVSRTSLKMKGLVAVQRKMLELIYIIYKTKKAYQADYEKNRAANLANAQAAALPN